MNSSIKQKEVRNYITSNKLILVTILETKVTEANVDKVSKNCLGDWNVANNNDLNLRVRFR